MSEGGIRVFAYTCVCVCVCVSQDFECDDVAALMSVIVQNAYQTEEVRGNLGVLNWIGDRLLYMAHLAKPNTIEGT